MLSVEHSQPIMEAFLNSQNAAKDNIRQPHSLKIVDKDIPTKRLNGCSAVVHGDRNYCQRYIEIDHDVGESGDLDVNVTAKDVNFNSKWDNWSVDQENNETLNVIPTIIVEENNNVEENECENSEENMAADERRSADSRVESSPEKDTLYPDISEGGCHGAGSTRKRVRRMGIIAEEPPDLGDATNAEQCEDTMERRISFLMKRKMSAEMRDSDLDKVKTLTGKLKLQTRRPSYVQWKAEHIEKPLLVKLRPGKKLDEIRSEQTLEQRSREIDRAITWLRKELLEMRDGDQKLARQLVTLRHDISQLKLQHSCKQYEEMIDDAQLDLEEFDEISEVCDVPLNMRRVQHSPLRQLGVTAMNIAARRFSLC